MTVIFFPRINNFEENKHFFIVLAFMLFSSTIKFEIIYDSFIPPNVLEFQINVLNV